MWMRLCNNVLFSRFIRWIVCVLGGGRFFFIAHASPPKIWQLSFPVYDIVCTELISNAAFYFHQKKKCLYFRIIISDTRNDTSYTHRVGFMCVAIQQKYIPVRNVRINQNERGGNHPAKWKVLHEKEKKTGNKNIWVLVSVLTYKVSL